MRVWRCWRARARQGRRWLSLAQVSLQRELADCLYRIAQSHPLKLEYLFPRVNQDFLFSSFPIQDLISEHYGEEGVLFEKEIKEFMELRQVSVP